MSVMRDRIISQGQTADGGYHPHGTAATPMVMPLAHVEYRSASDVYYEELQPLVAADGAVIPAHTGGLAAEVIPAGHP